MIHKIVFGFRQNLSAFYGFRTKKQCNIQFELVEDWTSIFKITVCRLSHFDLSTPRLAR